MIYGYARVSTSKQLKNGTSIEDQTAALKEAGAEKIVIDDCTGTKMNRPAFNQLMQDLKAGDTLIVTKLDRFARTAVEGGAIVEELHKMGVTINVLNMGVINNSAMGNVILTVMLAFAQFERDMIVERTKAGREARRKEAEARGETFQDFRPRVMDDKQIEHAMELLDSGKSYKEVSELLNVSKSTLIRRRREQRAGQIEHSEDGRRIMVKPDENGVYHIPKMGEKDLSKEEIRVFKVPVTETKLAPGTGKNLTIVYDD